MLRFLQSGAVLLLAAACSSAPIAPGASSATPLSTSAGQPSPGGGQPVLVPGGFDIDRVRLMEPADLPDGVPVPVPFGGEIDDSIGTFEGRSLFVNYEARFFATAAAFYAAWIEQEDVTASPLLSSAAGWEVIVDGEPVRIQVAMSPDETQTQLTITWD